MQGFRSGWEQVTFGRGHGRVAGALQVAPGVEMTELWHSLIKGTHELRDVTVEGSEGTGWPSPVPLVTFCQEHQRWPWNKGSGTSLGQWVPVADLYLHLLRQSEDKCP